MPDLASLRDQPGTQREYETIFIVKPESDAQALQAVNDRVRKVVDEAKGKLLRVENWGKRKLAYEIKKNNRGIYLYWRYLADPSMIAELERNLRLADPVIRFLTVKVDEDVNPDARPTDVDEERFVAASTVIYEEEDVSSEEEEDVDYDDDDSDENFGDDDDDSDDDDEESKTSEYRTVDADDDEEN